MRKTIFWTICFLMILTVSAAGAANRPCTEPIPDIFKRVSPSVVLITAIMIDPFGLTERIKTSIGSGFIVDAGGLILTNSHVVFGRRAIAVTLDSGLTLPAELMGADPILDMAVLKVAPPEKAFPVVASFADMSAVQVGDEVIAVGNPMGLEQTLTRGVVSGINRILPVSPMSMTVPLLQTDAAINPGNSGGPLINRCGEVVGMNTSVFALAENIGFALPADVIRQMLPQLLKEGRIIRPWLGTRGQLILKEEIQRVFNINVEDGFLVESVEPNSPAEKAGIRGGIFPVKLGEDEYLFGGDIIVAANDKPLNNLDAYRKFVYSLKVGDTITLTGFRNGEVYTAQIRVPERPVLPWDLPPDDRRGLFPSGGGPRTLPAIRPGF